MKKNLTWMFLLIIASIGSMAADKVTMTQKNSITPKGIMQKNQSVMNSTVRKKTDSNGRKRINNMLTVGKRSRHTSGLSNYHLPGTTRNVMSHSLVPVVASDEFPALMGSVIAADNWIDEAILGVYSIPFDDSQEFVCAFPTEAAWNGVAYNGVYYATEFVDLFGMPFIDIYGYDMESGEELFCFSTENLDAVPMALTVDPEDGLIYGFFYDINGTGYTFGTISYTHDGYERSIIREMDGDIWCALAINSKGEFYAIERIVDDEYSTIDSKLHNIDKNTGETTEIGTTGQFPKFISSAVIDPATDRMYWSVCPSNDTGWLCEVNLSTGKANPIYHFPNNEEIVGMYIAQPEADAKAPAMPENCDIVFVDGSLIGTVTATAPSTLFDGSPATGDLEIIAESQNNIIGSCKSKYGAEIMIPIAVETAGLYTFKVYAKNDIGEGPKCLISNIWVGSDTPEAPAVTAEYKDGYMHITWTAVTGSVNGGYINPAEVRYTISDNQGNTLAANILDTSYIFKLEEPESITSLRYIVTADFDGNISEPGMSNIVLLGAVNTPYIPEFDVDGLSGWTVIDGNDDGITWSVYRNYLRCKYNISEPMNDWLITPPIKVEANKAYAVTFTAFNQRSDCNERIEVKYGNSPTVEGMTTTLLPPTDITGNKTPHTFTKFATSDNDGKLYIGFHGISDVYMSYLNISDISIEPGISALSPAEVSDLKATPDPYGEYKATLSFRTPAKTINGQSLSSISKIEIKRNNNIIKVFENPAVDSLIEYEDVASEGGTVRYIVTPYNSEGEGVPLSIDAFLGTNIPAAPSNVQVAGTSNTGEVIVTWDEVLYDYLGNSIASGIVNYNIYRYADESLTLIAENVEGLSYSFQAVDAGSQDFVQCVVAGVTNEGEGTGTYSSVIPVGTPYKGMEESGNRDYIVGFECPNVSRCGIYDSSQLGITGQDDDKYFGFLGFAEDAWADMFTGLISLENTVNTGLTFYTYNLLNEQGEQDVNELAIYIRELGDENYTLLCSKTIDEWCGGVTEKWTKARIDLSEYYGKIVQIKFRIVTKIYQNTFLDNICIGSQYMHNLKATDISAPANVKRGSEFNVNVKITNSGNNNASDFTVQLFADEQPVANQTVNRLDEGNNITVTFQQNMPVAATNPICYYAVVDYNIDENEADNRSIDIEVAPGKSILPGAHDLTANIVNDSVLLEWKKPDTESVPTEPITQDFEDADSFSAEYGDWIFIDGDMSAVGGVLSSDIPNIIPGVTKGSFWIWDNTEENVCNVPNTEAHSGNKFLFSLYRLDDDTVNDWAISPALCGRAQTISFYAKSMRDDYPEKIEIYYSFGSIDPSDFILLEDSEIWEVPEQWTQYDFTLPEGAVRFAIRSCATASFMLMIDDVSFIPGSATAGAEFLGYDVYRNGTKLNDSIIKDTFWTDVDITKGEKYSYMVVTSYSTGYSDPSNTVDILVSLLGAEITQSNSLLFVKPGLIVVDDADGKEVAVVSADGLLLYRGIIQNHHEIPVNSGIYIVSLEGKMTKVIVP